MFSIYSINNVTMTCRLQPKWKKHTMRLTNFSIYNFLLNTHAHTPTVIGWLRLDGHNAKSFSPPLLNHTPLPYNTHCMQTVKHFQNSFININVNISSTPWPIPLILDTDTCKHTRHLRTALQHGLTLTYNNTPRHGTYNNLVLWMWLMAWELNYTITVHYLTTIFSIPTNNTIIARKIEC